MTITIRLPITAATAAAVTSAGKGAVIHHPRAGSKGGRKMIASALRRAGVAAPIVASLGWTTVGPKPIEAPAPVLPPALPPAPAPRDDPPAD